MPTRNTARAMPVPAGRESGVQDLYSPTAVAPTPARLPPQEAIAGQVALAALPAPVAVPLRLLLAGPPGSGKSTQGRILAEKLGVPHISMGELLRAEVAAETEIGKAIGEIIGRGDMAPNEMVCQVLKSRLKQPDVRDGFVLDGFPRLAEQLPLFEQLRDYLELGEVNLIEIDVEEDEVRRRLEARGRADDTPEVIEHRLLVYKERTVPVVEHFRSLGDHHRVDGNGSIEQTAANMETAVEEVRRA